jgi:FkbM family methyltransferase
MSRQAAQAWLCKYLDITLPYYSMGRVDTYDLFGPNELMLFAFYEHNRDRYKRVLDIGANVGLHSMLMMKLGWKVRAFEPDPEISAIWVKNVTVQQALMDYWIEFNQAAVSDRDGEAEFIRVLNNLTGSCLASASKTPYGPLERITVRTVDCRQLFDWADLAKIDVEGHESVLLACVTAAHLEHLDLICELRGLKEAASVLRHFGDLDCPIYTQKNDWKPAACMSDMPTKHQEGSIFISKHGGPFA